jgi:mono/diheme cytochrome c family protein
MPYSWPFRWILPALLGLAGPPPEGTQPDARITSGRATFQTYCAVCHGTEGRGDGRLVDRLRVKPPDLTGLARRNKGTYPKDAVRRILDGRDPVEGHGSADMPTWGDAFKDSREGYSEARVRERIDDLVEFLRTIQAP